MGRFFLLTEHTDLILLKCMKADILTFQVRLYSPDGVNSPVMDYLFELFSKNPNLAKEAVKSLYSLPQDFYLFRNIKHFKHGSKKFYELRVRHKNNICRFFFTVESPNLIVVYGFTKKTQKTEKQDIEKGIDYLKDYEQKPQTISLKDVGTLL